VSPVDELVSGLHRGVLGALLAALGIVAAGVARVRLLDDPVVGVPAALVAALALLVLLALFVEGLRER
jgi:hypothetical protein